MCWIILPFLIILSIISTIREGYSINNKFEIVKDLEGNYSLVINYDRDDVEFGFDFLSKENISNAYKGVKEYLRENARDIRIKTIKFAVSGAIIATIPFASMLSSWAAGNKYSMAYLYTGTTTQQIAYVDRTQNSLNTVSPSYFDINPNGSLKLNIANRDLIKSMHAQNIKVVPFISNHWDRQAGINALNNYEALATQIANYVKDYDLDGVNVDIENVTHVQRNLYTAFVASLRAKIPSHKEVSVAVAANPKGWTTGWHGSYDYTELARHADYLMIMAYDEHYEGGDAGPVAGIGWVESSIQYALKYAPKNKIVLGLPMFGRVWSDNGAFVGKGADMNKINTLIKDYNAKLSFDSKTGSPKAEFKIDANSKVGSINNKSLTPGQYTVWYENEDSIARKLNLVQKYDLKGAGSWSLGQESATVWNNYSALLNGVTTPVAPTTPKPTPVNQNNSGGSKQSQNTGKSTSSKGTASQKASTGTAKSNAAGTAASAADTAATGGTEGEIDAIVSTQQYDADVEVQEKTLYAALEDEGEGADVRNLLTEAPILEEASHGSGVLGMIAKGSAVAILGAAGAYFLVQHKRRKGYIRKEYLSLKSPGNSR